MKWQLKVVYKLRPQTPKVKLKMFISQACGVAPAKPRGNHLAKDTGHFNEIVCGTFVLSKLFEMVDVYDFKFGMERRQDFPLFDDLVVGIQSNMEEDMHFYAFQLKGCETHKTFGPEALFHEMVPPNGKKTFLDVSFH